MSKRRKLIATVLALIVIGALLGREYPRAGMVVVVVAIGIYILAGAKQTFRRIRNFKNENWNERIRVVVAVLFAGLFAGILFRGEVSYFPILLLFCIDLMMGEKR